MANTDKKGTTLVNDRGQVVTLVPDAEFNGKIMGTAPLSMADQYRESGYRKMRANEKVRRQHFEDVAEGRVAVSENHPTKAADFRHDKEEHPNYVTIAEETEED